MPAENGASKDSLTRSESLYKAILIRHKVEIALHCRVE